MPIAKDELSANAMGGTEQMKYKLQELLDPELLNRFEIICSRVRDLTPDLYKIYWLHDLPEDPESQHLAAGGWNKFEQLIFVSHWQMQKYIEHYNIPWYKCKVLQNAIVPIEYKEKSNTNIKLIYHTTPHRGLEILVPVFIKLCEMYDNIELDIFSSFEIYGWKQRDEPYQQLFDVCNEHPKINYHGFKSNTVVREALQNTHIFAYPCIWKETSCIALLEAMSAGCMCVHPDFGVLPETAANFNLMYHWDPNVNDHALNFANALISAIDIMSTNNRIQETLTTTRQYINHFYSWDNRIEEWTAVLKNILAKKKML